MYVVEILKENQTFLGRLLSNNLIVKKTVFSFSNYSVRIYHEKIFLLILLLVAFSQQTVANNVNVSIVEEPSVSISVNDIIIVSDVEKIAQYAKAKNLSERALEQVKAADKAYEEGVKLLQQAKSQEAIASFKTTFKNYKRAKFNDDALNFPTYSWQ